MPVATSEKEALAVVNAVKVWRCYLHGGKFTVITDHNALKAILKAKEPGSRVARWIVALQEYEFDVVHRPGKDMGIADTLSRDPQLMLFEVESLPMEQDQDLELAPYISYLKEGTLPKDAKEARAIVALSRWEE